MKMQNFKNKLYCFVPAHYTKPHETGDVVIVLDSIEYDSESYWTYNLSKNVFTQCNERFLKEI